MTFFFDRTVGYFVSANGNRDRVATVEGKRGDSLKIVVIFCDGLQIVELAEDATGKVGLKEQGNYDGDYVAVAGTWVKSGTGETTRYTFDLDLNTEELDALLGVGVGPDKASVEVMFELEYLEDGLRTSSNTVVFTVNNDVNRGGEGVPTVGAGTGVTIGAWAILYTGPQPLTTDQWIQAQANMGITLSGGGAGVDDVGKIPFFGTGGSLTGSDLIAVKPGVDSVVVLTSSGGNQGVISPALLTTLRVCNLPDADGTIALEGRSLPELLASYPLHVPIRNFSNSWDNFGGSQGLATLFSDGVFITGSGTLKRTGTAALGGEDVYQTPNGYGAPFPCRSSVPFLDGGITHKQALLESNAASPPVTTVFLDANSSCFLMEHAVKSRCGPVLLGGLHHTISSDEVSVLLPRSTPGAQTAKVCFYFHGAGDDFLSHITSPAGSNNTQTRMASTVAALLDDGWTILACNGGAIAANWGNPASFTALQAALAWLKTIFTVTEVVCLGQSMGALSSLRAVCQVPGIERWYGIYPVCDLAEIYASGLFVASMRTAYGAANDAAFTANSAGCDPLLFTLSQFNGKRFRMTASASDTIVPKADHADALAARITGNCYSVAVVTHTGDHGDATAFQPSDIIAFFNAA